MGLINTEEMQLRSGLSLANCYLSFSPAPTVMGLPVTINKGSDGKYTATAVMYVYPSEDAKSQPNIPLEEHSIQVSLDAGPVFDALYAELKKKYTKAQDAVKQPPAKEEADTQESQGDEAEAAQEPAAEPNQAEDAKADSEPEPGSDSPPAQEQEPAAQPSETEPEAEPEAEAEAESA